MFINKLSRLLINSKSLPLMQRLDPVLTCASNKNSINYFQEYCKCLCTSSVEPDNVADSYEKKINFEHIIFPTARNVLASSEVYTNNLASALKPKDDIEIDNINQFLMKSWISMSSTEFLDNFEVLSHFAKKNEQNIMNLEFAGVVEIIQSRCKDFSDDELYHLLLCLELWVIDKHDAKFLKFWKIIDNECLNRFREWSIDKVLLFNDQFYRLKLTRFSNFSYRSLRKISYKVEKFSRTNLIHYAFLTNTNRKMHINLYNHEYYIERQIDKLSIEELAIFASTIYYYQSNIKSKEFLKKMIQKLKKDINVVSNFALIKILKILRVTNDEELINEMKSLLDVLETQVSTRPLKLLIFIADLQKRTLLHHSNLTKKVIERFEKEFKEASVKDFEKLVVALSTFQYEPKNCKLYSIVMNELLSLDRAEEISKYQKSFSNIIFALHLVNFYSEEALRIVLDPKFLETFSKGDKYFLTKEFLFLDYFIQLLHPQYNGPRIQKNLLTFLTQRFGALYLEKDHKRQGFSKAINLVKQVLETCQQVFSSELAAYSDALLPQFAKYHIVICKDLHGNIISSEDKLSQIPNGTIKYAPKDGNNWYAVVVAEISSLTRETFEPTGITAMELRYLELIGYTPILVPYFKWRSLVEEVERQNYIKEIFSR